MHDERNLVLSNQELQIISDQTGVMIDKYTLETKTIERFYDSKKLFNLPLIQENVPESIIQLGVIAVESVDNFRKMFQDMHTRIPSGSTTIKMKNTKNSFSWYQANYTLIYEDDQPIYSVITFFDNTKEREMEIVYEKWHSNLSSLLSESLLYAEFNLTKNTVETQQGSLEHHRPLNATSFDAFTEYGRKNFTHPDDVKEYKDFFNRERLLTIFKSGVNEDSLEYRTLSHGEYIWIRANVKMIKLPQSDDILAIIAYLDINVQHKQLELLSLRASHDPLTGVLNREMMEKSIKTILSCLQPGEIAALFIIDIDNFKEVNDQLGHLCGDETLKKIASNLSSSLSSHDIIARLGGDEFIVFLYGPRISVNSILRKASQIVTDLQLSVGNENKQINVSVSVGVTYTFKKKPFDFLYQTADKQLYLAKRGGKCQYCIINADTSLQQVENEDTHISSLVSLHSILENMDSGAIVMNVNSEFHILYISPSYYKAMGFTVKQTGENGENILNFIHPEDKEDFYAIVRQTVENCEVNEFKYRALLPKQEGYVWRLMRIISMANHNVLCLIKDINDLAEITERTSYLKKLLYQRKKMSVWEIDIQTKTLNHSLDFIKHDLISQKAIPIPDGVFLNHLVFEDDKNEYLRMCHDIFEGVEGKTYYFRSLIQSKYKPGKAYYHLIRDKKGVPTYALGIYEELPD